MPKPRPLQTRFFSTEAGNEPVRDWLRRLDKDERQAIGTDILTVQFAWPVGKPLVDSLGEGLWEIRTTLSTRIARVFFIVVDEEIILLHGIIKKTQKAPVEELKLARGRQAKYLKEQDHEKGGKKGKPSPRK